MTQNKTTAERVLERVNMLCALEQVGEIRNDQALFCDKHQTVAEAIAAGGIGLDSLDRVELAMHLEEEFNIEIPDEAMEETEKFATIDSITAYLDGRAAR